MYKPYFSMQYMWFYVQYRDSSTGRVGISSRLFNNDALLQKRLKSIITRDEWQWLEQRYGFVRIRS